MKPTGLEKHTPTSWVMWLVSQRSKLWVYLPQCRVQLYIRMMERVWMSEKVNDPNIFPPFQAPLEELHIITSTVTPHTEKKVQISKNMFSPLFKASNKKAVLSFWLKLHLFRSFEEKNTKNAATLKWLRWGDEKLCCKSHQIKWETNISVML